MFVVFHHYNYALENPGNLPDSLFLYLIIPIGSLFWGCIAALGITVGRRITKDYRYGCTFILIGLFVSIIILISPYVGSYHSLSLEKGFWVFMADEISNESYSLFLRRRFVTIDSSIYSWIKFFLRGAGYMLSFILMVSIGHESTPKKREDNVIYL